MWRAIPVEGYDEAEVEVKMQAGPPTSAEDYMLMIRYMSKRVPDVMLGGVNPRAYDQHQTKAHLPVDAPAATPASPALPEGVPDQQWQKGVISQFRKLQRDLRSIADSIQYGDLVLDAVPFSLPPISDWFAWKRLWLGPSAAVLARSGAAVSDAEPTEASRRLSGHKRKRDDDTAETGASMPKAKVSVWMAPEDEDEDGDENEHEGGDDGAWLEGDDAIDQEYAGEADSWADSGDETAVASSSKAAAQGANRGAGRLSSVPMEPVPPMLRILMTLDHVSISRMLEKAVAAYNKNSAASSGKGYYNGSVSRSTLGLPRTKAAPHTSTDAATASEGKHAAPESTMMNIISVAEASWLYALVARLETPVTGDVAGTLRPLFVICRAHRALLAQQLAALRVTLTHTAGQHESSAADDMVSRIAALNVLITVIGRVFAQRLAGED
jgi:hypothetical protein